MGLIGHLVGHGDLQPDLGQEADFVFSPPVNFLLPLLPAKTARFGNGQALDTDTGQRFTNVVELERFDDGFD